MLPQEILSTTPHLYIATAGIKGRGVFAAKSFKKGELVERCCILEVAPKEAFRISGSIFESYVFLWDKRKKSLALVLGYGSLYNHDPNPNCFYSREVQKKVMVFRAAKDIQVGEEVTIHYGPSGDHFIH